MERFRIMKKATIILALIAIVAAGCDISHGDYTITCTPKQGKSQEYSNVYKFNYAADSIQMFFYNNISECISTITLHNVNNVQIIKR